MTFHKTRNILTPLYDMWFLISCLLYVLAVTTSSRWKSPVQHQKAFWPSYFRGCRRYGGYEHAVRTGHQPANSWETKGVYDNDFTTSIKISLVRRYYFICTPFLLPVDLYPCTLDMLTFSGDLFFTCYLTLTCLAAPFCCIPFTSSVRRVALHHCYFRIGGEYSHGSLF